jgi:hypothetical protein
LAGGGMKITWKNEKIIENCLEFLGKKTGLYIIVSVCLVCQDAYGVKFGGGHTGRSHGYCQECLKNIRKEAE